MMSAQAIIRSTKRLMAFSASIACEAAKALVDISLAFLVAAALLIVNIRVCLPSRHVVAADEPKPEEAAANESKRGRLGPVIDEISGSWAGRR